MLWAIVGIAGIFAIAALLATGAIESIQAIRVSAAVGLALLLFGSFMLLNDKSALRDMSTQQGEKPYSFSRVQLWWWTLIVLGCYLGAYAITGKSWELNETCLILLGISTVTTAGARMVDNQQENNPNIERHQNCNASEGFLTDILSDENGLSVHRFQALIFNVAYGLTFVVGVFTDITRPDKVYGFPTYDSMVLSLLGISSGAYIVMKMNENTAATTPAPGASTATPAAPATPAATSSSNDELVDPENGTEQPQDH